MLEAAGDVLGAGSAPPEAAGVAVNETLRACWTSVLGTDGCGRPIPPACSEKGVRSAQKMEVGPCIPVGIQL